MDKRLPIQWAFIREWAMLLPRMLLTIFLAFLGVVGASLPLDTTSVVYHNQARKV